MTQRIYSFGPGSSIANANAVHTIHELDQAVDPSTQWNNVFPYHRRLDETRKMLEHIETWQAVQWVDEDETNNSSNNSDPPEVDPTWGFYVFVTSYSDRARASLPGALNRIIEVSRRVIERSDTLPPYATELQSRLRLEVVEDTEKLNRASTDRVRNEFHALLLARGACRPEQSPPPPARNMACIALDEESIVALDGITLPEDPGMDYTLLQGVAVTVVDVYWEGRADRPGYRGVGRCPVLALGRLYELLTSAASNRAMEELGPLESGL